MCCCCCCCLFEILVYEIVSPAAPVCCCCCCCFCLFEISVYETVSPLQLLRCVQTSCLPWMWRTVQLAVVRTAGMLNSTIPRTAGSHPSALLQTLFMRFCFIPLGQVVAIVTITSQIVSGLPSRLCLIIIHMW